MKKALLILSITLLLYKYPVMAGWVNKEGDALPDTSYRKAVGDFGSQLILTDKEWQSFENWDRPSETVHIESTENIKKGDKITALIIFSGCSVDLNGNCNLLVKFTVLKPDGSIYADLPEQEAWVARAPPPNKALGMSIGFIRVIIEPNDPLGKYKIIAEVRDKNANQTLQLSKEFQTTE